MTFYCHRRRNSSKQSIITSCVVCRCRVCLWISILRWYSRTRRVKAFIRIVEGLLSLQLFHIYFNCLTQVTYNPYRRFVFVSFFLSEMYQETGNCVMLAVAFTVSSSSSSSFHITHIKYISIYSVCYHAL